MCILNPVRALKEIIKEFKEDMKSLWSFKEKVLYVERENRVLRHEVNQLVVDVEAHEEKIRELMGLENETDEGSEESSDDSKIDSNNC